MSSRTLKGNRFSLIALFKFSAPALYEYKYIDRYLHLSPMGLLGLDLSIIWRGIKVILQGKGL